MIDLREIPPESNTLTMTVLQQTPINRIIIATPVRSVLCEMISDQPTKFLKK
jgi:hypothetical protein